MLKLGVVPISVVVANGIDEIMSDNTATDINCNEHTAKVTRKVQMFTVFILRAAAHYRY